MSDILSFAAPLSWILCVQSLCAHDVYLFDCNNISSHSPMQNHTRAGYVNDHRAVPITLIQSEIYVLLVHL
jgi:hypothetical protein